MAQEVVFELELAVQRFQRNMDAAIRSAQVCDNKLKEIIRNGGQLDQKLGNVQFKLTVDTSDLDRAEAKIKGIDGQSPTINVLADFSNLDKVDSRVAAIDGVTPQVNVMVDTTAFDRADARVALIDGSTPEVTVGVDTSAFDRADGRVTTLDGASPQVDVSFVASGLSRIESAIADLDDSIRANVDVSVGGDTEMLSVLENIQSQGTISLAIQLAGTGREILNNVPIIGAAQDQSAAERLLQSRAPGADQGDIDAINDAFSNNFGETREQVAQVAVMIKRAGGNVQEALLPVLQVAQNEGLEVTDVFMAMDRIVASGLVPNFKAAANFLTVGFQEGGDRAGDLLDTVKEYSGQFAAAGVSAEGFLGFLTSGLEEGAFNADKVADMFKEAQIRLEEGFADPESAPGQALARLFSPEELGDMTELHAAGELAGDAFMEAVIARVQEKGTGFDLFELFGSGAEDLTIPVVEKISFNEIEIPEDAAAQASATINDTLAADLTSLIRTFETEMLASFEVAGQTLDEWINGAQEKVQTLGALIRSGEGLPEALEIALEAPGLADRIREFEASIGDFVIELQLVVASVLDFLGKGDAAAGIRTAVADQAGNQLEYELQFAADNEAELAAAVQKAFNRGVEGSDILTIIQDAASALTEGGQDIEAQTLLGRFQEIMPTVTQALSAAERLAAANAPGGSFREEDMPAGQPVFSEDDWRNIEATREAILESREEADAAAPVFTTMWEALKDNAFHADEAGSATTRMGDQLKLTTPEVAAMDTAVLTMTENLELLEEGGPAAITAIRENLDENGDGIVNWFDTVLGKIEAINDKAALAAENVRLLNEAAGGSGGGTFEEAEGKAGGGDVFAGRGYKVGERGVEYFVPGMDGSIIPHELTQMLLTMQGSGGGGITNNYVTLNNTINAQGNSGAFAAGRSTADKIRGMV
jgi:hypothetical protein